MEHEREINSRTKWEDDQMNRLADKFVEIRRVNFKDSMRDIWEEVFKALPDIEIPKSTRNNPAWTIIPSALRIKIKARWDAAVNPPPAPEVEPQEPPAPIFIRVEVEKAVSLAELLAKTDTTTLVAQLEQRRLEHEARVVSLLETMVARLGAVSAPMPAPAVAKAALPVEKVERRPKRVAIIGPIHDQVQAIKDQVQADNLFVEPRFIDKETDTSIPPSCDYVIVTKHSRHAWYEKAKKEFGNGSIYFIDGPISQVVQKLRDIASMK